MDTKFINFIEEQIVYTMKLGQATDPKRLTGLRNIKSDFVYLKEKNKKLSDQEIIQKMYKSREEAAEIYSGVNQALWEQETAEMLVLEYFLPEELDKGEVIKYLNELDIPKEKKNFKKFQTEAENHFGQKVESTMILDFIDGRV